MNTIKLELGEIATITLSRPQALNALNEEMIDELLAAVEQIKGAGQTRCVIVTGEGEKSFAAGADIGAMEKMDRSRAFALAQNGCRSMDALAELEMPVIAAINGYAMGGGLELALACDIRIAMETALLGFPEVTLGIMPGWSGTRRLAQIAGYANAAWLVFSGAKISADEACRMGIVNMCTPQAEFTDTVKKIAGKICACAPLAVAAAKKSLRKYAGLKQDAGFENQLFSTLFDTQDQKLGMQCFNQKKKIERFEGK